MGHVSTTPKIADLDSMQFLLGGGGQSSDLNDSFAATTPANKPVFKKVFGDTTTWETEVGVMTFSFVFDPKAAYDQGVIMASAWSDVLCLSGGGPAAPAEPRRPCAHGVRGRSRVAAHPEQRPPRAPGQARDVDRLVPRDAHQPRKERVPRAGRVYRRPQDPRL